MRHYFAFNRKNQNQQSKPTRKSEKKLDDSMKKTKSKEHNSEDIQLLRKAFNS